MVRAGIGLVLAAFAFGFMGGMIYTEQPLYALLGGIVGVLALLFSFLMWTDVEAKKIIQGFDEFFEGYRDEEK